MAFGLESSYAVLDGNDFSTQKEVNSNKHFFSERTKVVGILNFGYVPKGSEVKINLSANGITSPIIIDSIIAFAQNSTQDEIYFYLYTTISGKEIKIGTQRYSNSEMPIEYPDGIIFPDMTLGVKPTKADTTVVVYAKPVEILFEAVPNPQ